MIAQGAQIDEEYYFSVLLDRANRTYLAMARKEGGVEIEQLAVERPEALARVAVDPIVGIDDAKAREIVDGGRLRRGRPRSRSPRSCRSCGPSTATRTRRWSRSTRWSRPQTAASSPSTARSRWTTTPASVTPTTRPSRTRLRPTRSRPRPRPRTSTTSSSTARSASSATAPDWSCRRSTSSPTPARSSAAVKPAELPGHRRRRSRRGHGRRPAHHPGRPEREVGVRQRLRRHHRPATRWPTASSGALDDLGDEATKPLVVRLDGNNVEEGRRILAEAAPPLRRAWTTPWTAPPARPPSWLRPTTRTKGHTTPWPSFSTETPRSSSRA